MSISRQALVTVVGIVALASPAILRAQTNAAEKQKMSLIRAGEGTTTKGPDQNFTGKATIQALVPVSPPSQISEARITFEPGARSAWHTHPLGQLLIVTAGIGWVQQEGGEKQEIKVGDVVWTPPGVKHWHGATATSSMTHIAVVESLNGKNVNWMEKVSDEQYGRGPTGPITGAKDMNKEPSGAEKMFGDFAPKLVELTDKVLFGDIWERPELSKRDRSLVTVAALVALNRPEQLRFHLPNAVKNGVKEEELIETITHLAFYSGWPNAMSCMAVAKELFAKPVTQGREK